MAKNDLLAVARQELRTILQLLRGEPSHDALRHAADHHNLLLAAINSQIVQLRIGLLRAQVTLVQAIDHAVAQGTLTDSGDVGIDSADLGHWRKLAAIGEPEIAKRLEKAAATATDQCRSVITFGKALMSCLTDVIAALAT